MKTKTKTLTLALVFSFCAQFSFSDNLNTELIEENYIDDIPFNTEEIVSNIPVDPNNSPIFTIEEENYIDDIPFSTKKIYDSIFLHSSLNNFKLEDEANIDDIPFDTKQIALKTIFANNKLAFDNKEKYIDDIPFNTYLISISSSKYSQIDFANISNKMLLKINNYYNEQVDNLTQKIIENIFYNIDNNGVNLINTSNFKIFQY